ncbi:MAG: RNA polymerase sigma factor [Gammaproteobacteria bacterium]|nr:RNA polymerase sigma factor [Gammaproteobacteria bacterium]NIN61932.1 RNA polymerase sigma factor [Gammaproteobacteria bacterium]NIO62011.1 RNA polymerase sigma factor [Gammaproteobacteria bacterium]NIQ19723.1 RNA polymerase sigma factor [Gammaproteobacteria bacterium]NIT05761.1 RNA polymerase sigma factor [Gammaproteobacteria bacterium]
MLSSVSTLPFMKAEASDEELMLSYREGDAKAFEALYSRHKGALYRFILRRCGQPAVAEELYQEVWMKLIRAREGYTVKARFTTWMYQVARNHCIDYYRRQSVAVINDQQGSLGIEAFEDQQSKQPDQQLELQQQTTQLMQLVEALPVEQREAFLLREEAGLGLNEIAEITGVNPETAKSRLRYAINKLRAGLNQS